jgi:hypothetical protein
MSRKFDLKRDINGYNGFGLDFSEDIYDTTLVAGVEQTLTIPGNFKRWIAIFAIEPGAEAFIAKNATATLPGAAFATTDSELNPVAREVKAGDVLHFITPAAATTITVSLYGLSGNGLQ